MVDATFGPGSAPLVGEVRVPGDKSLSHRAVLFSAMALGTSRLSGVLDSADVRSTIGAVRQLGADVKLEPDGLGGLAGSVTGWGDRGPRAPESAIDCGNSGTTARLLLGVLAGWPISATLSGDESLSKRPMRRVTAPLAEMGASFSASAGETLPLTVGGRFPLHAVAYQSPVASAQVKTAVLLAGLRSDGLTCVTEPAASRDHTERLLPAFGVAVEREPRVMTACVQGPARLSAVESLAVPGDPSSAAFLVAAGVLVPGSRVTLRGVSLNETRIGFLHVLQRMGADVRWTLTSEAAQEGVGDIEAGYSPSLSATTVTAEEIPSLVDEVPIMALVASQAAGDTRFLGVGELRVKESDRLSAIAEGLSTLGVDVDAAGDDLVVGGRTALTGGTLDSLGDHRLAMTWAVAGLVSESAVVVERFDSVEVSYPGFEADMRALRAL